MAVEEGSKPVDILRSIVDQFHLAAVALCTYGITDPEYSDPYEHEAQLKHVKTDGPKWLYRDPVGRAVKDLSYKAYRLNTQGYGQGVAVTSMVETTYGQIKHIPMADFQLEPTRLNQQVVVDEARRVLPEGTELYVLNSGRGLHLYADPPQLLTPQEWTTFLESLPNADSKFIDMSHTRGYSSLRAGAFTRFKKIAPRVVRITDVDFPIPELQTEK